jgi:hypothetical protein
MGSDENMILNKILKKEAIILLKLRVEKTNL